MLPHETTTPAPGPPGGRHDAHRADARRADARRNRDKLVRAATATFTAAGGTVPLEVIARAAGVGIGTLYRHFPTRDALVEAVYAAELDDVTGCVPELLRRHPPDVALRAWMQRYAAFVATKQAMAQTLRASWTSGRISTPATRERITAAVATILAPGVQAGTLRADVDPGDITTMLIGTLLATTAADAPDRTERILDLLLDALRPPQRSTSD